MRAIYYDTETTGISSERDYIIELAAYDPERGETFNELINPGVPIPPASTAIHNITDDMVADKGSFGEVAQRFMEFCEGEVVLIAHNNDAFDLPFLESEFKRADLQLPNWKFVDSLKWARRYRSDLPRHSLQLLREHYNIEANNAHRALDDVVVLHKVFMSMIDDLSIETVYSLMQRDSLIKVMPFGKYKGKPIDTIPKDYVDWLSSNGALAKRENESLRKSFEKAGLLEAATQ